ncbi:hypothetical protein [Longimicrobium sp.]|jgi:cold shock CspA family protein|uniref:cold-shock protein n=1 Tax=Longimicrobium sp. TaxID=2029185 RepID=UPI002ED88FCE
MQSYIKSLTPDTVNPGNGWGFVAAPDGGRDYYFTHAEVAGVPYPQLEVGMQVTFTPNAANRRAKAVQPLSSEREPDASSTPAVEQGAATTTETIRSQVRSSLERINEVENPEEFEDSTFLLLRLLGIHDLYQFDRANQAGKADGFFHVGNLAVMYDCTLRSDYYEFKRAQIENYANRLATDARLKLELRRVDGGTSWKSINVTGKTRQVWIITRGQSRELETIDEVKVKEVAISDLLAILHKRLTSATFECDDLAAALTLVDKK